MRQNEIWREGKEWGWPTLHPTCSASSNGSQLSLHGLPYQIGVIAGCPIVAVHTQEYFYFSSNESAPRILFLPSLLSSAHSAFVNQAMTESSSDNSSLLEKISQLVHASLRPLPPRFGDGRYNSDVSPEVIKTGILKDLASQAARIPNDIDLLVNLIAVLYRGGVQDDSKFFVWQVFRRDI